MKALFCDCCRQPVVFENFACVRCGSVLAFLPDTLEMAALEPIGEQIWQSLAPQSAGRHYRLCANYQVHQVCNWAVQNADPIALCLSCRLTRVIPDVAVPSNHEAWRNLEAAKRRVLYSILHLRLPVTNVENQGTPGLVFEFQGDASAPEVPVMTGHDSGVITVNVAEADDAEREKRRLELHEPYRTLLGHFRHETGHYYWNVIVKDSTNLAGFRNLFGDEQQDYALALARHYEQGPPSDWQDHFVSAYATMHPWEDWAETWAHYLHMTDALETAATSGLSIDRPGTPGAYSLARFSSLSIYSVPFDTLLEHWLELAYVLNNLNRSLGLKDGYPFILSPPAIEKLRFAHETIRAIPG